MVKVNALNDMGTLNMKEHQLRSYDKLVRSVRSFEWFLKEIIWSYYEWNMRGFANTVMSSQFMHLKKVTSFRCFNQIIINNHLICHMSYITSCSFLWLSVYLFIFCPRHWISFSVLCNDILSFCDLKEAGCLDNCQPFACCWYIYFHSAFMPDSWYVSTNNQQ